MEKEQPNFYAIIPANIRYDKDLIPNAKLLYGEITALCNDKGYCWATNDYFAKLYNVSKASISNWVASLIEKHYIESEIVYKECSKEILHRYLRILYDPIKENFNTPIKENFKDNNTTTNNTNNNTDNIKENIKEILDYLNLKAETSYKYTTEKTKSLINARLKEHFTVEDFKKVIDKMCDKWKGTDWEQYLRPETLFGTKFESYLNAKTVSNSIHTKHEMSQIDKDYEEFAKKTMVGLD